MIAVIVKELRENLKWAALILLILSFSIFYSLRSTENTYQPLGLLGDTFTMATSLGFAAAGFALGLIQTLQDGSSGRWGFLIHRPVPPSRIFWAKVVTGLAMYFLATTIPLAAIIVWVKAPGHVAEPFEWHMTLPSIAHLITGVVWYAAGLLTGIRHARWVGSRLTPIGVAIFAMMYVFNFIVTPSQAALCVFLVAAILLIPAAAAFSASRDLSRLHRFPRLLATICVGAGITIAVVVGGAMLAGIIDTLSGTTQITAFRDYSVDKSGQVFVSTYKSGRPFAISDLAGHPIDTPDLMAFERHFLNVAYTLLAPDPDHPTPAMTRQAERFTNQDNLLTALSVYPSRWYYVRKRGTIEGYDPESRMYIGGISPNGFVPAPLSPAPFLGPLTIQAYGNGYGNSFNSRTEAYFWQPEIKNIRRIMATVFDDPILGTAVSYGYTSEQGAVVKLIAVATSTKIHVFSPDLHELISVPVLETYKFKGTVGVGIKPDGQFIFLYPPVDLSDPPLPGCLIETDEHGKALSRTELPPLTTEKYHQPPWEDFLEGSTMGPLPLTVAIALADTPENFLWPMIIWGCAIGVVIGLITLLTNLKRFSLTHFEIGLWVFTTLLIGIAGPLLMFSMRHRWPLARCPSCGKKRVVSRQHCEHCRADFEKPPEEGIEVFEMATT